MASDSELVIPRKETQTTAKQQLGSDDNKLPPGGTETQMPTGGCKGEGGVYEMLHESRSSNSKFLCSSITAELANWPTASSAVWPFPCWAPEMTAAINFLVN